MASYYTVLQVSVHDIGWVPGYEENVPQLLAKHGGRYVAQGGGDAIEAMEGDTPAPDGIVIVEWPSREAARAFFSDPAYQPHQEARLGNTSGANYLVPGVGAS